MISRIISVLLFCAGLLCLAQAQVPMTGAGVGAPGGGAPAYTGPGDLTLSATFVAWYGFSCFTAAYSGNVASIWDHATNNTTNTVITCSAGSLVTTSPSSLATTCAVACDVDVMYDQSGTHCDSSVACRADAAGMGAMPPLNLTGAPDGTKMCMTSGGGAGFVITTDNAPGAPTFTQAIPFSMSMVQKQTTVGSGVQTIIGGGTTNNQIRVGFENTAAPNNKHVIYNGVSFPGAVASNNAFHAFNDVFDAASASAVSIDGTATTGLSLGSSTAFSTGHIAMGLDVVGTFCEGGILNGALSTGDMTALSANQHTRWNF